MKDYGTCKVCEGYMLENIIQKLKAHEPLSSDESFTLAQEVSNYIVDDTARNKGINIIIYVLDNWNTMPQDTINIWADLVESVGFYPYIDKIGIYFDDLGSQLRTYSHYSDKTQKYFHEPQKQLADLIFSGKNVVASAPTSFGKSLLIEEIVASLKYKNIVIVQPTLALLDETRQKLSKYKKNYKIILRTSQLQDTARGNIFLLTAERVLEYPNLPAIDILIIDEFYKLSNLRGDNRSNVLNNAFLKVMRNEKCQFYLLGPNIDGVSVDFLNKYDAEFYRTDYSLVLTEETNKFAELKPKRGKIKEEDLFAILDDQNEQTLIFCASPATARKLAFAYGRHLENQRKTTPNKLPLIEWIDKNISWGWSLAKCLNYGIGVHDGAMPKHITTSTIRYFNANQLRYLFCTNTIIEGVNTSAKNVIYYDDHIGTHPVDYFDYSNIRGRAGRLMEHYIGKIINLKAPPKKEQVVVDIPLADQNPIDSEVLVNLEEEHVKDLNDNKRRYNDFKALDVELQTILKRNAVSIEGQMAILKQLEIDVKRPSGYNLINWNRPGKNMHNYIQYILDLCWENLSTEEERKSFGPKNWVRAKIVSICFRDSIGQIIENEIRYRLNTLAKENSFSYSSIWEVYNKFQPQAQDIIDKAIEDVFSFQKNWQSYRAPKWINVVDSLQKYVCNQNNLPSGDYSYVAEMIENSFIDQEYRILLEYGLPQNAVETIQGICKSQNIPSNITEEELLQAIKMNLPIYKKKLDEYELDILKRIL